MSRSSRRRVLRAVASGVAAVTLAGRPVGTAAASTEPASFEPTRDGFGFRNWAADGSLYPEHRHDEVSETEVEATIRSTWRQLLGERLGVRTWSNALVKGVARQLYVSVNQQTATNGHCFGMAFAAQQYFENPETLPLSAAAASEFVHPATPPSDPSREPVGELIDLYHNTQTLNPWSWLGRRRLAMPRRIDLGREVDALVDAVDEYRTATVTLAELGRRNYHQVLVYDYRTTDSTAVLQVYDPNLPASFYRRHDLTIEVDRGADPATMTPFRGYDRFVFNRHDRRILASGEHAAHVIDERVTERVSRLVLFLLDSTDLGLVVRDPAGRPVGRDTAATMTRGPTEYSRMRYRYGAPTGEYRVAVVGRAATTYRLSALAAEADGSLVDVERTASIEPGETHEYVATIPATPDEPASLRRAGGENAVVTLGVGALAAGAGAAAYRYYRRR